MAMMNWKWNLTAVLFVLIVGCVQPPSSPSSDIEASDNNTVTSQAIPTNGLKGDYYDNVDFTGTLKTQNDATVNKTWNSNAPITGIQPTTYSVRWTGQIMPAFSQTYTFFVTSSDGARLMVNGQVLVDDWVDGSSRVRSGTVALQANVKYDIRLEYYRNATNPGTVKLEWQSSSRTKQVVPQANLFVENLDAQNAMTALKVLVSTADLDPISTITQKGPTGMFFLAREKQVLTYYYGYLNLNGQPFGVQSLSVTGANAVFKDFGRGKTVNIANFLGYFKADGSIATQQRDALARIIAPAMTAIQMQLTTLGSSAVGQVRTQSVADCFVPPPACSDECIQKARAYAQNECGRVFSALGAVAVVGGTIAAATVSGPAAPYVLAFGLAAAGATGLSGKPNWDNELPLLEAYWLCLRTKNCLPVLLVAPQSLTIEAGVGSLASGNFIVTNSSEVDSTSPLKTLNGTTTGTGLLDPRFTLNPGESKSYTYLRECPLTPGTISDVVTVTATVDVIGLLTLTTQTKTIPVTINCTGQALQLLAAISDPTGAGPLCESRGYSDYPCVGVYWHIIATNQTCKPPAAGWQSPETVMCGDGIFIPSHEGSPTANVTAALGAAGVQNIGFQPCRAGTSVPWSNTTPPITCVYGVLP